MKKQAISLLCLGCFMAYANPIFAQQEKLSLALEFCPIINYNNAKISDPSNASMTKLNGNLLGGLTFYYSLSEKSKLDIHLRYSGLGQRMYNTQYFGYLHPESYSIGRQSYAKYSIGIDWNKRVIKNLFFLLGGSINILNHSQIATGYHHIGTPQYSSNLAVAGTKLEPHDFLPSFRQFSLNAGFFREINIGKKNKQALLGLRFSHPFGKMPQYEISNIVITQDNQIFEKTITYNSRYYQTDLLLAYKIFRNFE